MSGRVLLQSMRGPFLVLTPVCVLLGVGTVVANKAPVDWSLLILCLFGALLAHVSVNALNEYADFRSGLDLATVRTPFSGGSGALPQHPEMARAVLVLGVATLVGVILVGLYFLQQHGLALLPLGLAGLLLIVSYTGWVNRHPFICLIAPGLGFGVLMVVGTQYVLQGQYSPLSLLAAVVPFFLVNNLLLLNQYPDIKADAKAGRYHFPIAYGVSLSNMVYGLFALATATVIIAAVQTGHLPMLSLIALLPMPLAFFSLYGAVKHGEAIGSYPQYLGANVAVTILTTLLLGISLVI